MSTSPRPALPNVKRLLVFRTGHLGDTLIALPALRALRETLPDAYFTLLCDRPAGKSYVLAADVLTKSDLIDEAMVYVRGAGEYGEGFTLLDKLKLLARIRLGGFDALAYLHGTLRPEWAVRRDLKFYRLAGIRHVLGAEGFTPHPPKREGEPLATLPHEADMLLSRLGASGVPVPEPGLGAMDLGLNDDDFVEVHDWRAGLLEDGGRPWIAIGPGSKMPVKRWPVERYREVVAGLIARFDVWPVIFGGPEDRDLGHDLIAHWGRGHLAAGSLGIRPGVAALTNCRLYLGNDTGTMHMAVCAGLRCVVLMTARDYPGKWNPYGPGHLVLRRRIDCEGCMLEDCIERKQACLLDISSEEVLQAASTILEQTLQTAEPT